MDAPDFEMIMVPGTSPPRSPADSSEPATQVQTAQPLVDKVAVPTRTTPAHCFGRRDADAARRHALGRRPIFDGVCYWLNPFMTETLRTELREQLGAHGAVESIKHNPDNATADECNDAEENALFGSRFSLTHFAEYEEARTRGIHIVTPTWVRRATRNGYVHKPEFYSPEPDMFLSGIVVTTSQIPDTDRDAIFGGVEAFGGQWQEKMVKEVTHLVTLSASGPRYESAMQNPQLGIKVVLPHWLDDCFRLQRRIPEHRYLFPDPIVLRENPWVTTSGLPWVDPAVDAAKDTQLDEDEGGRASDGD
ncbi:BRCT domain-containing protein, partial [Thamnocephalis sphaerospora]